MQSHIQKCKNQTYLRDSSNAYFIQTQFSHLRHAWEGHSTLSHLGGGGDCAVDASCILLTKCS